MKLSRIFENYSAPNATKTIFISSYDSPVGTVISAADDDFIYLVSFEYSKNLEKALQTLSMELGCSYTEKSNKILLQLREELKEYFDGNLKKFTVPIKTIGSDFQREVWDKLQELPYASTTSYGEFAKAMGRHPSHSRAVGAACGANRHLLVVPCHRLVATTSKGGFSSGVDLKEKLLQHEERFAQ